MANPDMRRAAMTLISGVDCLYSHSTRIILREKDVECEYRFLKVGDQFEGLAELNPYAETPTLIDRDLVLYDSRLICEYLDERFPHPPLMAVDPVGRGKIRLIIHRLRRDWLDPLRSFEANYGQVPESTKKLIRDGLISISPIFREQRFLAGNEYGMADSFMSPLLWRLVSLGIRLPKPAAPLVEYADRLFDRPAFRASLTETEKSHR